MKLFKLYILFSACFTLIACGQNGGNAPSIDQPSTVTPPAPLPPTALTITPLTTTLAVNNTANFTASGGAAPYSYAVLSGSGSVLSTTGNYTAGIAAGSAVVRVTDSTGQVSDAIVTINAALLISPSSQSLNINDVQVFGTSGGVSPITYSLVSGGGSINVSTGVFTAGAVAEAVVVRATDSLGNVSEANVNVFDSLGISPLITNVSINSTVNFSAAGGSTPYVYSLVSGGGSINASTGVYIADASVGSAVVRVTDAMSNTADANINIVNAAPVISVVADQNAAEDLAWPVNFTITDVDSTLNCASSMSATSSNTSLIPVSNIVFSGTAPNCTATLTPVLNQSGSSNIVLSITDGVNTTAEAFVYNVSSSNDAPLISAIGAQNINEDNSVIVNFTINDSDSTLNCSSSLSASTSNSSVIAVAGIIFGGTAPNCSATVTPVADQNGAVNLTFRVSDAESLFNDSTFTLTINAINDAPTIAAISAQSVKTDSAVIVNYTINDIDSSPNCTASITASSGNTAILPNANIVKSGTAPNCVLTVTPSLNLAGASSIAVSVSDGSLAANTSFNLGVINVVSVAVTPSSFNLAATASLQLVATATYSDASTSVVTTSAGTTWASSAAGVATVNNSGSKGLVSGVSAGASNITASYEAVTSNNSVANVITATSVSVSTGAVSGGIGAQFAITATAQNTSSTFDVTSTAVWTSSNNAIATVSNGVISLVSAGSAVVTASYAGLTANVNVTVANKSLISITISGGSTVQINGTRNLVATANYSDASTQVVTNSVVWASANTSVLSASNTLPNVGRVTGVASGTSNVTAVMGSVTGSLLISVNSVTISSIAITPYDALVASGSTYALKATATYSDATTADITDLATWASSNSAAATVSNTAGSIGVVSTPVFTGYRTTNITATLSSVTGTSPLGVNGATVTSVIVTPTVTVTPNQTYQLSAYANLSDGGTINVTQFAVWSSSNVANVTVSNSVGSKGLVTGIANGTSTITAQFNSVSGTRAVTVAGSGALTEIGVGLLGSYHTWTGGPPPSSPFLLANKKGERIDARVNYAWAAGNAPMGVGDQFSVRWTGFYKATAANNYFCTYSDDGVRVWINGVQVINNWTEHGPTWNCSTNQALVAGTKYSVVIEYYENGGGSEIHFTRSSVSAADAQNTTTRAVQQVDLYPQ